ncbi:large conductance mechanosensitive channel protein MscL [Nakamurella lactea]|uniref:large conductance mechanosensitive channel protein MscL n=1 Tax=Nakamurella lactea TaxID=459515 RepID=UPI0004126423|nr:large conductance mechanosensitive channel protein MscL [Nakamurella lactea]
MVKGFRDFIMRGNVIELAIAVVIGVAFQAMVDSFVSAFITPLLNTFGGASSNGLGFSFRSSTPALAEATYVNISAMINAIIVFLLTALVVYLALVLPMNKLAERKAAKRAAAGIVDDPEPPSQEELLAEIRDLLKAQQRN